MKQPPFLLKLAVLSSSMLLAGGCVSYRAGAFNWLIGSSERPVATQSNSSTDEKQADNNLAPPTVMYGFKSPATGAGNGLLEGLTPAGTLTPDAKVQPPPPDPTPPPPTIMYGLKA